MKIRVLFIVALGIASSQRAVMQTQSAGQEFVAGEVLIQFEPGATIGSVAEARESVGAARRELLRQNGSGELELARVQGLAVDQAVALLRQHPAVRSAEPNWIYRHTASNDPFYTSGQLWGMLGNLTTPTNQFGSQAGEAWDAGHTGSASVAVGVIDEGVDINHPDLAANIWTNPVEQGGVAGVDDDGNGYVDDLHGWDFSQNNNSVYDGAPSNNVTDSHGTHVSGTIGASGGNAQGVAGVNWNVTIIPAKFLGPNGGTLANAVKAIDYITDLKSRHSLNIVATNNSWGGGGFSQALLGAIVRGANAGILFVAAAGNGDSSGQPINNDITPNYPSNYNTTAGAGYDAVIAVASLTSTGTRSSWSNYGNTTVDLGAPGSSILSTTPNNTYAFFSGTSMATPHVAGAVALYASLHPAASALEIRNAILASATATPTTSMTNLTVTNGRLNIGHFAGSPPPTPNAPTNLTATAVSANQINLTWTDNSSNESGFDILRCQGAACVPAVVVASVGAGVVSFSNTGLAPSTLYRYQVRAFNIGGPSAPSNVAQATTQPPPAPNAPTNLTATAVSASQVNLAWADNSTNESGFDILRCQGAACVPAAVVASVGAGVVSFSNTGLAPSTLYRYQVRAFNTGGPSAPSNVAQATTHAPPPPAPPTNLTATAVSASQVNLAWADNSSNESGFDILRCQGAACVPATVIASVGAGVVSFSNTGLTPSTLYRYQVRAVNAGGPSAPSNVAEATTHAPPPPNAPTNLTATAVSANQINLTWTDNSSNESGFDILRCQGAACVPAAVVASVGAGVVSFSNTGLAPSTLYRYQVRVFILGGASPPPSNVAQATTLAPPPPVAPTNLTATAVSASHVNLAWTDNSSNESGFDILRCQGAACVPATVIASVGAGVVSFSNTGLAASTLYRYQVRAVNAGGPSAPSNVAQATTQPPPAPNAPTNLTATAVSASQVNLAWADNSSNESGFDILRCQGAACVPATVIASVGAGVVSFSNTGLAASTLYRYQVRAVNAGGPSAPSNVAQATTQPPPAPNAPTNLTATAVSASQVNLAWADNSSNESGFDILRCQGAACVPATVIASVGAGVVSFSNTGLAPSTLYRYQVRAVNAGGPSAPSNVAQATTHAPPPPAPTAPSALTAIAIASPGQLDRVDLAWADNSTNEDGFTIERCLGLTCTNFTLLAQVGANVNSYSDTNLVLGGSYRYRVRAFNAVGNSAYSNIAP